MYWALGLPAAAAKVKFYNGGHPGNDVRYALYVNDLIILRDKSGDRDGDGLPDTWENRFFGGPTNAVPGAMAANGVNTVGQAYIADLDPTDPAARFPPIALGMPLPGNLVLRLDPTSTARIYRVEWTTNLAANPQEWNLHLPEEPGTGAALDFILTNDALQRIYRTGVRLP